MYVVLKIKTIIKLYITDNFLKAPTYISKF